MSLKKTLMKTYLSTAYFIEAVKNGELKNTNIKALVNEEIDKKFKDENLSVMWNQRKIALNFFVSGDADGDFYNSLSYLFYPYNIGWHFKNGTPLITKYLHELPEDQYSPLDKIFSNSIQYIRKDLIKMNYYMEQRKIEYKNISQIKDLPENCSTTPVDEHFLFCLKVYYTIIFPEIFKIEKLLEFKKNSPNPTLKDIEVKNFQNYLNNINLGIQQIQTFGIHEADYWLEIFPK